MTLHCNHYITLYIITNYHSFLLVSHIVSNILSYHIVSYHDLSLAWPCSLPCNPGSLVRLAPAADRHGPEVLG